VRLEAPVEETLPRIMPPSTGEQVAASRPNSLTALAQAQTTLTQNLRYCLGEPFPRSNPPRNPSRRRTMVDAGEAIGKARAAVTERAELPGMSLMEHLDELRRRIVHSAIYLAVGFGVVLDSFATAFVSLIQAPLNAHRQVAGLHPPHGCLNLQLQVAGWRSDCGFAVHPLSGMAFHRARSLPERSGAS
jgi:hypothetical protein